MTMMTVLVLVLVELVVLVVLMMLAVLVVLVVVVVVALSDPRARAETDMALHEGRPPDAAVLVFCGARGVSFYQEEGVESAILREVWGRDVPAVGFFAGGEFGPVGLRTYLHSYTTSCLFLRLRIVVLYLLDV
ncbi:hypothetical protein AK812_SmicGene8091 [Symbiodinium microadriaticum]|uniref:FIST C-domain domain-containing protein n=1 Tax=Symbiodinium microadriaticum TaxID=2951 RepID=A0A1Q9EM54_SYMMI|nr:hypothetical protein AK812_SmicGene8091 [Symbiodinium microadriaticum]